jgi:RNA12 protein
MNLQKKGALDRIIDDSASEILKIYVFDADLGSRDWTREQAWYLIKALANADDGFVPYNRIMLSDLFKEDLESRLQSLEDAELITIITTNGRPSGVKPGRPVYHAAFRRLIGDGVLRSRLDLAILGQLISIENKNVKKYEDELHLVGTVGLKQQPLLEPRLRWVLQKLSKSQVRIDQYERESAELWKFLLSQPS